MTTAMAVGGGPLVRRAGHALVAGLCLALCSAAAPPVPSALVFEAEAWTSPTAAWQPNTDSPDHWNLWSTDSNAAQKWSGGGVVLRSPPVMADRATPEEGAPVLHTRITGIPAGRYEVEIKLGRALAVSRDGKTWTRKDSSDPWLGEVVVAPDQAFELWVDDRYAEPSNKGSAYYDALIFVPLWTRTQKPPAQGYAQTRVRERLDRGLVALPRGDGRVYLSWRLLAEDPADIAFNVWRTVAGERRRLNPEPLRRTTDFLDATAPAADCEYRVTAVIGVTEGQPCPPAQVPAGAAPADGMVIPLDAGVTVQKAGIGDLDGDGRYEIVIKQPQDNIDPAGAYWQRSPDTYKLEAYTLDGKRLWRYDLGWSIERGIWYSPYIVFDLDGDGRAEVAAKTGEGDPRGADGRVETGPEYLSILDGATGKVLARTDWLSRQAPGDVYNYNLSSRNQICVAYLDGKTPCLLVERGTYTVIRLVAYEFRDGRLRQLWEYDNREDGRLYRAQGAHIMHAADVDGDGRDEVILGSAVIDDNGNGLWSTGFGHPDFCFVGDILPSRPGLEIFYGIEPAHATNALCLADARTGQVIWGLDEATCHVGTNGMCADIDASYPGLECHAADLDRDRKFVKNWLFSADGRLLSTVRNSTMAWTLYWDDDLQHEQLRGSRIGDFAGSNHGPEIKGRPVAIADLVGDWREELITSEPGELRVYSTAIPAADRRPCLMQDPIYRIDVAVAAMGYWGAPMLSTCLAAGRAALACRVPGGLLNPGATTDGVLSVQAANDAALKGRLSLTVEGPATASFAAPALALEPGAHAEVPFTLTVPAPAAGVPEGRARVKLRASFGDEAAGLRATAEVVVADLPLALTPRCEAEASTAQGGGAVQVRTDKAATAGSAISHWDSKGHWLEWTVDLPRAGNYRLAVRYCTPGPASRGIAVDGNTVPAAVSVRFPATGGFGSETSNDWQHALARSVDGKPLAWALGAGRHTIRLTNVDGNGMNLDYLLLLTE